MACPIRGSRDAVLQLVFGSAWLRDAPPSGRRSRRDLAPPAGERLEVGPGRHAAPRRAAARRATRRAGGRGAVLNCASTEDLTLGRHDIGRRSLTEGVPVLMKPFI